MYSGKKIKRPSSFDPSGRRRNNTHKNLFTSGEKIVTARAPIVAGLSVPSSGVFQPFRRPVMKRRAYGKSADRALKQSSLGQRRRFDGMAKLMARAGRGLHFKLPSNLSRGDGRSDSDGDSDQEEDEKEDEKPFEPLCVWVSPAEGGEARGLPPMMQMETRCDEYGVEEQVEVMKPAPASAYAKTSVFVPPILAKWLRPHQREGLQFLYECVMSQRHFNGAGCILADDMGLGKTLQSVALIYTLLKTGLTADGQPTAKRVIVVCPCSLVKNWDNEFTKWLGPGGVKSLAIADQDRKTVEKNIDLFVRTKMFNILIASYECIRTHADRLNKHTHACDLLVCDEAHRLKNRENQTSRALNSLLVRRRILLTGTPMQNDLSEFFAMVDFTNPGVLGSEEEFRRKILNPILRGREPDATERQRQKMMDIQQNMSNIVNEFILRRINTLNAQHLPPKLVQVVCCQLTDVQKAMYQHLVTSKAVQHVMDGKQQNSLSSIQMLMKLCNHPKLVVDEDRSSNFGGRRGKKRISYSEQEKSSAAPGAEGISKFMPSFGGDNSVHPELSGKMFVLYRLMREMRKPGNGNDKIVVISNYTQTLDLIARMCKENNWKSCRLDGSVGMKKRQAMVDEFNDPASALVAFLLSSKAGGCGINLIGGNRLVLFDPDWNPAVDKQAAARCWREGQKKRCFTYRFLATGTVEEKIFQRQLSKEGLQSIVDDKEQVNALSSKDLRNLFKLRENTPSDTHDKLSCKRCKTMQDNAEEIDRLILPKRLRCCAELLSTMMEHEYAKKFLLPLDPESYGVDRGRYDQLVKQPMDLGTIHAKLAKSIESFSSSSGVISGSSNRGNAIGYDSPHQFSKDVNRVFTNVQKVWSEGILADSCRSLQAWWLEQWTGLVPKLMSMKPDKDNNIVKNTDLCEENNDTDIGNPSTVKVENCRGEEYQEQIGMPDEENMRCWSHHFSTDTCDDPIFRAAMRGYDSVSFVFGLEVTWSLIQQRQQEEEEQKAMEALQELDNCDINNEDQSKCDENNDGGTTSSISSDESQRADCIEVDEDEDDFEDERERKINDAHEKEKWELHEIFSRSKILKNGQTCQSEECAKIACSEWRSNKGECWLCCLDCQKEDFGEWPKTKAPNEDHRTFIRHHCSKDGSMKDTSKTVLKNITNEHESERNTNSTRSLDKNTVNIECPDQNLRKDTLSPPMANKSHVTCSDWSCAVCTFANKADDSKCFICSSRRSRKRMKPSS